MTVRCFYFPTALGSVRQAGPHGFDLVNFAAANLENFSGLQIRCAAVHLHRIDSRHAFDLNRMNRSTMLEHREGVDQPLLFIDEPEPAWPQPRDEAQDLAVDLSSAGKVPRIDMARSPSGEPIGTGHGTGVALCVVWPPFS